MVAGATTMATAPPAAAAGGQTMAATTPRLASAPTLSSSSAETGPTRTRNNENRRSNKPIMEKRRRARINNCLNELKTLILDAMKKDPARHSKLEKADILEMTVKHLETLQRQQVAMAAASDPTVANKFRAGFTECAGEVGRFPGLDGPVKRRLLQHLANCLNSSLTTTSNTTSASTTTPATPSSPEQAPATTPLQVHIVRAPPAEPPSNIILTSMAGQGLHLVPTRLPNGDIALILPSSNTFRTARTTTPSTSPSPSVSSTSSSSSPLPMLIPIPNRPPASSPSPVAFDRLSVNPPRQVTIVSTSQRVLIPQVAKETKMEEEVVVTPNLQPPVIRVRDEEERVVMTQDGRIIQNQPVEGFYSYPADRETFLHIPDRDYYEGSQDASPKSPVNYSDTLEEQRYEEYYSDHMTRSPSPDSPLALVTRRYDDEYDGEGRPWRPW